MVCSCARGLRASALACAWYHLWIRRRGNRITVTNAKRQPVGQAESGSQCGTAGTGNGTDDDGDTVVDDGCPSSKFTYDALDRLQSSTDALGRGTSYQYEPAS